MNSKTNNFPDERSLVAACIEGVESAWAEFQALYTPVIYSIARWPQWRFAQEDAEDICEDVFMKLIESGLRGYNFGAALKTYVASVAKNACLDRVRERNSRNRRTVSLDEDIAEGRKLKDVLEDGLDVAEQVMGNETTAEINLAYNRLADECRTIIRLRYREELSYDQIARYTNMPLGTVCSLVSRCTERLMAMIRHLMEPAGRGEPAKRKY